MTGPDTDQPLSDGEYRSLALLRREIRNFLAFSEQAAGDHGVPPAQHQLLLAIRGHPGTRAPTIGDVADALGLRPHSAGELAARAEANGFVTRVEDPDDARRARLELTLAGAAKLAELSMLHRAELRRRRSDLEAVLHSLD